MCVGRFDVTGKEQETRDPQHGRHRTGNCSRLEKMLAGPDAGGTSREESTIFNDEKCWIDVSVGCLFIFTLTYVPLRWCLVFLMLLERGDVRTFLMLRFVIYGVCLSSPPPARYVGFGATFRALCSLWWVAALRAS